MVCAAVLCGAWKGCRGSWVVEGRWAPPSALGDGRVSGQGLEERKAAETDRWRTVSP